MVFYMLCSNIIIFHMFFLDLEEARSSLELAEFAELVAELAPELVEVLSGNDGCDCSSEPLFHTRWGPGLRKFKQIPSKLGSFFDTFSYFCPLNINVHMKTI